MQVIVSAIVLIFGAFFMMVSSVAGLLFIPIMIFMSTFFPREKLVAYQERGKSDPLMHIPLKYVPEEHYEAYALYLKSPEWHSLRREVLKRDKHRCVDCGAMGKLQAHHIHYDGVETMTFTADQCVAVCHDCHDIRHGKHLWK